MPTSGLVEHIATINRTDPRPDEDILTEATARRTHGPPIRDLTGTSSHGGRASDGSVHLAAPPRPRPDGDTITRQGAESDHWQPLPIASGPKPRPDDDTITFTQDEADSWSSTD
jgi:hypothetical protein